MSQLTSRSGVRVAVAAVLAGTSVTAVAQEPVLDQIIVTAERRETSLQETPISVAAFSAQTMELKGLETLEDVANWTPNLDIKGGRTGGNISPTYQVRGLTGGGGAGGERSVAMYIDGVFMPRTTGPFLNVLDIERVEVLRGPQGTLFGRNSTGGAIRVFTAQPGPDREGNVKLSAGSFNRADLSAMINVPITDKMFFRAQGGSLSQDGYVTRGSQELGGAEDAIGRLQLAIDPSDSLRVTFALSSVDSESDGTPSDMGTFDMAPNLNFEGNNADWVSDFLQAAGQPRLSLEDPRILRDDYTMTDWCFVDDINPDWDAACEQRNNSTYRQFDVHVDFDLNDVWTLTSVTGLSDFESAGLADNIGLGTSSAPTNVESEVVYQELQFSASLADGRFELVTGLSYFQEDSASFGFALERRGSSTFTPQAANGNTGAAGGLGANGNFRTGDNRFEQNAESYGVFANLTWAITERLALTPGVRVSYDEKNVKDTSNASNNFTPAPGTTSTTITTAQDWSDTDWRLTVDYDITDDFMIYATASKAFRAGAYSYTIPSWTAANNATSENLTAGLVANPPFVAPESVENHEIGMRTEWLDGRLRANLTVFDMDYSNRQAAVAQTVPITQAAAGFIIVTQNTGDVFLEGIELEGQFAVTDNVMLDFSAGNLDYELANVCANNGDFLFPGPADDSYSLGARWLRPLSSGAGLTFALSYGWTGKQQTHPGGVVDFAAKGCAASTANFLDSRYQLPDYGLWNGRARYESADGNWSVTVFGNNLTDEVYGNYASRFGGGFWDAGAPTGLAAPPRSALTTVRGRPREYGVTFQYNFAASAQ